MSRRVSFLKPGTPTHGCEHCSAMYTLKEARDLVQAVCAVCKFGHVRRVRW